MYKKRRARIKTYTPVYRKKVDKEQIEALDRMYRDVDVTNIK